MAGRSGLGPGATDVFLAEFQKNILSFLHEKVYGLLYLDTKKFLSQTDTALYRKK